MVVEVKIEGTRELSNALVEMFSPITEALGTLGDRVRVYRHVSLLRSLKKAKEIAVKEGIALTEPSLKFLVPYLEDCSLENPEDDIDDDFDSSSIFILKALGLIGDFKSPEIWFGGHCFVVYAYYVTGFGAKFAQACTDIVRGAQVLDDTKVAEVR